MTQKSQQVCFKCKAAGFDNQLIGFEKVGENPATGKPLWKLLDPNGAEHKHKGVVSQNAIKDQRAEDIKTAQEQRKNEVNALLDDGKKTRAEMRNLRRALIELIAHPANLPREEIEATLGLESYEEVEQQW